MEAGQFVRWSSKEEDFAHIGMIVEVSDKEITIATEEGEMTFPANDGIVTKIRRPSNFHFFSGDDVKPPSARKAAKAAAKATSAAKAGTKKAQAIDLLKALDVFPSRQEGIALLVEKLEMTPAGASTYYAAAKKALS